MVTLTRAMSVLVRGCIGGGIIKNFFSDPAQEEAAYELRFGLFRNIAYPAYVEYGKYQEGQQGLAGKKVRRDVTIVA